MIILKIDHTPLLWFNVAAETKIAKLENDIMIIKYNIEFLGPHTDGGRDAREIITT